MTASYMPGLGDRSTPSAVTPMGEDELLTTAEVALMLRTPNATLRTWRYQGIGPRSFHLGPRGVRYRKSDVLAWLERQYGAVS